MCNPIAYNPQSNAEGRKLIGPDDVGATVYGIPVRAAYPGEDDYFRQNRHVAGMAAEDDKVTLSKYSSLSKVEMDAVATNEAARVHMRKSPPKFSLTREQQENLSNTDYKNASEVDRASTIAARLLSGDKSGGTPTKEQSAYIEALIKRMGAR